ncbi:calcium-binding protein [Streptomyces sp. NPDC053069]|uniref:calcium-binding protein n=1 Tax=Streptomyces sp. NPDC053069 TaxID=3365695 RepID=UPI0037D30B6F
MAHALFMARRPGGRYTAAGCAGLLAAGTLVFGGAAEAAAQPTCFGVPATIQAQPGVPTTGTPGNDVIVGTSGHDSIDGLGGDDLICGLDGNDLLFGGLGDDQIDGGAGGDDITGDVEALAGNAIGGGNDHLYGGDGGDFMVGDSFAHSGDAEGAGDDVLMGGPGQDELIGDCLSSRNARGSGGDDFLDVGTGGGEAATGDHVVNSPRGGTASGSGNDRIFGSDGFSGGPGFDDTLVGDSVVPHIPPTAGNDVISGRGGDDLVFGDNANLPRPTEVYPSRTIGTAGGDDDMSGADGVDTLRAGPGNDSLNGGPDAPDYCNGEAGTDRATECEILRRIP